MNTIRTTIFKYILFSVIAIMSISSAFAARTGAVYAMTNKAANSDGSGGNGIVVYTRARSGMLTNKGTYLTGGLGTGGEPNVDPLDALGSQSPLILNRSNTFLFAVNAASNNITVFRVKKRTNSLIKTDIVDSNGLFPVSMTLHNNVLYVLNSGGAASISGFNFDPEYGTLTLIPGSTHSLNFEADPTLPRFLVSPAQISFNKTGNKLIITIKQSNSIEIFTLNADSIPILPRVTNMSHGRTPFGFGFDRKGHLLVAEAFGEGILGQSGASAVSSYIINHDNSLTVISPSIANSQTASCWLGTNNRIPFAYTTNNMSNSISGYKIARDGSLSLLNVGGITANTGADPVDLAITRKGNFLYVVNAGDGTISMYKIHRKTGALTGLGSIGGLPVHDGAVGIVAR